VPPLAPQGEEVYLQKLSQLINHSLAAIPKEDQSLWLLQSLWRYIGAKVNLCDLGRSKVMRVVMGRRYRGKL
jgi:hypothetical protein